MKKIYLLILGLILIYGCAQRKEVAVRINDFTLTKEEFEEELKEVGLIEASVEEKEKFLENLIDHKLILLEAERLGLDKEREFLKEIENFYEKNLLKIMLDKKSKEITAKISVEEREIQALYDQMREKGETLKSYDEIYEQLRWQILREKQNQEFGDWLENLRKEAKIKINRELLGIKGSQLFKIK